MSPRRAISGSNFEESVIHVSAVRHPRGVRGREERRGWDQNKENKTSSSRRHGTGGGRDRTDSGRSSNKGVAIFVWTSWKAVSRWVEDKGRGHWEARNGWKERRGEPSVVDDDDSVSYLARDRRSTSGRSRGVINLWFVDDSRPDWRERREKEKESDSALSCREFFSNESSARRSPTRTLSAAHHGSIPINKAVNAARVDWLEIIRALWNCASSGKYELHLLTFLEQMVSL